MPLTPSQQKRRRSHFVDSNAPKAERTKRGRPSLYDHDKIREASALAFMGATDEEMAEYFKVHVATIRSWQLRHPEFAEACFTFGEEAHARVERSLYRKALEGEYKSMALWLAANRKKTYGGLRTNNDGEPALPGSVEPETVTDRALALAVLHLLDTGAREGDKAAAARLIEGTTNG